MSDQIILNAGGTKAQDFPKCDATVTGIEAVDSKFKKNENDRQLRVTFTNDAGESCTNYYGGVYANRDGGYYFGPNGKARQLLSKLSEAANRELTSLGALVGARVHVAPASTTFQGKTGWKTSVVGPALTVAPERPVSAPKTNLFVAAKAPAAPVETIDGEAAFNAIEQGVRDMIGDMLMSTDDESVINSLIDGGYVPSREHAVAAVAHAHTLGA